MMKRSRQPIWMRLSAIFAFTTLFAGLFVYAATPSTAVVSAAQAPANPELAALQVLPTVRFAAATATVGEADGTVTLNILISAAPLITRPVTVTYTTVDGSATAGLDYGAASGTVTFANGQPTARTIVITILNDALPEANETFSVVLQSPQNATLATPSIASVTIQSDDASATPTGGAATPVYSDIYENNNDIPTATTLPVNNTSFCTTPNATLWPVGDIDFYRFWAKAGAEYEVQTKNLALGLDTMMSLYGVQGQYLADNDDSNQSRASYISFIPAETGYHYVSIINKDASDPANKTYCVEVTETVLPTSTPAPTHTPQPTATLVQGVDICESNNHFDEACTIGTGDLTTFNFVPVSGPGPDNDFFRLWVKVGWFYTCETLNLSSVNDTNVIIYDQNRNGLAGNDDKASDDLGSKVTYYATYTGWLFVLVGPYAIPNYDESPQYTYDLMCDGIAATPTPTPRPTTVFTGGSGGGTLPRTPTPTPTPEGEPTEAVPTPDIIATVNFLLSPTPTPPSIVQIVPLPTATPLAPVGGNTTDLTVILYYDQNSNFTPELDEGIMDMAVSVFDGVSGQLLSFGYTNEAGLLRFTIAAPSNILRVSVPFLGFNQTVVAGTPEVRLRVVPQVASGN
ncbi:MAG: pre-peptidase C-terminal domain-containing protein [Chloroflexi bacterium]|nr:pre-peptidase C-terminal domain-containing protein [Chloroflexota bacterium]